MEWFVQHAAERIAANEAFLMWGSVLRIAKEHELTFATTNYDRAIELAANAVDILLDDGFELLQDREVARWVGFNAGMGKTCLVKLHGSTDWYTDRNSDQPLKLRHPMPLFGLGTLRLSSSEELGSSLVLPSREKLLTKPPYPRLSQAFLNAADQCEGAIFVGSSMRDPHIRDAAIAIGANRSLFVVNPHGNSLGLDNVHIIEQPASQFLISTLPAALSDPEPLMILHQASWTPGKKYTNILGLLRVAMDGKEQTKRRCEMIENLDRLSINLDEYLISELLSDENGTVSRFALGLVPTSVDRDTLLGVALKLHHATDDVSFEEELTLLKQMIEDE